MYWTSVSHDDVIKWKHFPRYWPFVRGIHRSPVNSMHKGQWRETLMFSLICGRMNGWANNGDAGDLKRQLAHYDVVVMNRGPLSLKVTPKPAIMAGVLTTRSLPSVKKRTGTSHIVSHLYYTYVFTYALTSHNISLPCFCLPRIVIYVCQVFGTLLLHP